jgi:hypothetical protein
LLIVSPPYIIKTKEVTMRHVQLAAMFIVMAAIGPWAGSALAADPPGGLKEKEAQSERLAKEGLTGTLATIDGEFYVVEDSDGQMHRLHVDKSTKLDKLAVGNKVKAFVTKEGHVTTLQRLKE